MPKCFGLILSLVMGIVFLVVLPALAESVDTAWVRRYNGPGDYYDVAYAVTVDTSGNVYVTGESWGGGMDYDYTTIKYVQSGTEVADEIGEREKPSEFTLFQNHPNPFNQTTKIEFTLAKSGFVSLNIYDLLGRKVRTSVSEHLSSGYKSVFWDGKNDPGKMSLQEFTFTS